jgi:hypothetical protein
MHKVQGNYNSSIGTSNENICSNMRGPQVKGKRGQNKMKLGLPQKNGALLNFEIDLEC